MSGGSVLEHDFPADAGSIRAARSFVVGAVGVDAETAGVLELVVSELATNAVLHARSPFSVRVDANADLIRVEVSDASPEVPAKRDYGTDATTGRGLRIVEGLVDRWGTEHTGDGKSVWVELDLPRSAR